MTEFSAPLVPAGVNLRDYPYTPIFRTRLFGSSFHARTTDAEWRAGVTLWLKSWDQVPTGSLPDDDIELCRLAELGRDQRRWRKLKAAAMRGWVRCSDGRLYHPVVAEGVLEAWGRRSSARRKGLLGAAKRYGSATHDASSATEDSSPANGSAIADDLISHSNRNRSRSRREGEDSRPNGRGAPASDEFDAFWSLYPRKDGKGGAKRAWATAVKIATPAEIIAGLKAYPFQSEPKYHPMPATWLNGERWLPVQRTSPTTLFTQPEPPTDRWNNF